MAKEAHQPETMVSLQEYMEARLSSLALAVEKQETAYNLRFEGVNEWRQTYGDLANQAVSKEVFDTRIMELERRIGNLEQRQANIDGRIAAISGGIGLAAFILSVVFQLLNFGG